MKTTNQKSGLAAFRAAIKSPAEKLAEWLATLSPTDRAKVIRCYVLDGVPCVDYCLLGTMRELPLTPKLLKWLQCTIRPELWAALCHQADTGEPLDDATAANIAAAMNLPNRYAWPEQPFRNGTIWVRHQARNQHCVGVPLSELIEFNAKRPKTPPRRKHKKRKPK